MFKNFIQIVVILSFVNILISYAAVDPRRMKAQRQKAMQQAQMQAYMQNQIRPQGQMKANMKTNVHGEMKGKSNYNMHGKMQAPNSPQYAQAQVEMSMPYSGVPGGYYTGAPMGMEGQGAGMGGGFYGEAGYGAPMGPVPMDVWTGPEIEPSCQTKMRLQNLDISELVPEDDHFTDEEKEKLVNDLKKSSYAWMMMMSNKTREYIIKRFINEYRQKGAVISKEPSFYIGFIDNLLLNKTEMMEIPLPAVLQIAAIIEYDFTNGQDKDAMAKKVLGENAFKKNKERLGLK